MKRTTELRRTARLTRQTPLRKRGRGRFRDRRHPHYLAWVKAQPCLIGEERFAAGRCCGPIDADHVQTRAAGGADYANLVPLCRLHHNQRHCNGIRTFERAWRVDLKAEAERLASRWPGAEP